MARPTAKPGGSGPRREAHALTGRSVRLDPLRHAVRPDLADIRLADRVFAPHYAEPLTRTLARSATLLAGDAEPLAQLERSERFDVLELAGGRAWGVAPGRGLVGYVDADALAAT